MLPSHISSQVSGAFKAPGFQEIARTAFERFGLLRMLRSTLSSDPTFKAFWELGMHRERRRDDKSRADAVVGLAGQGAA